MQAFAVSGAALVGLTALARMAMFVPPPAGQDSVEGTLSRRTSCGRTTCEGDGSRRPRHRTRLAKMGAVKLGSSSLKKR